jgi:hypothetical protein
MSTDYIYEKEVSGDKELEKNLRKRINTWAKSVPNHPYKNLGDQIQVESIFYKPAYPIRLLTQYESRSKDAGHEPFENQKIPTRTLFSLDDFNSWDISLPDIEEFTNKSTNYYVDGSQYIQDCFKCKANGWITCPQCAGRREVTCPNCSGKGRVKCSSCGGGGYHRCNKCYGSGKVSRQVSGQRQVTRYNSDGSPYTATESYSNSVQVSCSACSGKGRITCSSCGGSGNVVCSQCRGRGLVPCPTCSGQGRITCPTCQGHKQLMHYFYVERTLEYSDKNTCMVHENIYNAFPEFLDNHADYESYNLMSITEDSIKQGVLPEGHHLNPYIDKFLKETLQEGSDTRVLKFQRLDIDCIDTWELKYTFKGKEYTMAFTGSEYEIIPGLSPVYEVAYKDWKAGVRAGRFLFTTWAYRQLKKASSIDVYEISEKVNDAFYAVSEKIKDHYSLGVRIAGVLALFLGSFLVYTWFKDVNPVLDYASFINRPDHFLHKYHAWAQVVLFLVLGFWSIDKSERLVCRFKTFFPHALLRILMGMIVTVVFIAISMALLGLVNVTGITILADFGLLLAHWVFKVFLFFLGLVIAVIYYVIKLIGVIITRIF